MFLKVYVDEETFTNMLFNRDSFDACLQPEEHVNIELSVPLDSVYDGPEPGMVTVSRRR